MIFVGMNQGFAQRALALVRRAAVLAAVVLFQASGAWAQSIDVNRPIGRDPATSDARQTETSRDRAHGAAVEAAGGSSPARTVVEPIPPEQVPATWLVRDASGSATLVCGRSGAPPQPGQGDPARGPEFLLK